MCVDILHLCVSCHYSVFHLQSYIQKSLLFSPIFFFSHRPRLSLQRKRKSHTRCGCGFPSVVGEWGPNHRPTLSLSYTVSISLFIKLSLATLFCSPFLFLWYYLLFSPFPHSCMSLLHLFDNFFLATNPFTMLHSHIPCFPYYTGSTSCPSNYSSVKHLCF